jgi:hypothetical protein
MPTWSPPARAGDHGRAQLVDRERWPHFRGMLAGLKIRARSLPSRRAQTYLRALGIELTFSREGRVGSRLIRMRATRENTVCTVSMGLGSGQPPARPARECLTTPVVPISPAGARSTAADDADGADANASNRRLRSQSHPTFAKASSGCMPLAKIPSVPSASSVLPVLGPELIQRPTHSAARSYSPARSGFTLTPKYVATGRHPPYKTPVGTPAASLPSTIELESPPSSSIPSLAPRSASF